MTTSGGGNSLEEELRIQTNAQKSSKPVDRIESPEVESPDLNTLLSGDGQREIHVRQPLKTSKSTNQTSRTFVIGTLVALAAAISLYALSIDTPSSILNDLADEVIDQQRQFGRLPRSLVTLQSFPEGYIEWPVENWAGKSPGGEGEIIWLPDGDRGFAIVLRSAGEAWVFDSRSGLKQLPEE